MLLALVLIAGMGLVPHTEPPAASALVLRAADGVAVFARSYAGTTAGAPVILLFHQAGSSKDEYAPIAPRLVRSGFNVLAIDQRAGGDLFAPGNETVRRAGKSAPYLAALADMEAALAWAQGTYPHVPVYAWGSSYSASLAFALAAKHPHDIAAVLAFSPGEYFADKHFVRDAARRVRVPVFIDSAADAAEERATAAIAAALGSQRKVRFVPQHGVHGSSTLRDDRDPAGAAENWRAVDAFLSDVAPR